MKKSSRIGSPIVTKPISSFNVHTKKRPTSKQDTDNTFHLSNNDEENPQSKPPLYLLKKPFNWYLLILFIWLLILSICFCYHVMYVTHELVERVHPMAPILEIKKIKDKDKWEVPFTLIPDDDTRGRLMTVKLTNMTFKKLIRYDVCCFQQAYFFCRSITKNMGVDAYLTNDKTVVIQIKHPDMVSARCKVLWTESL